MARRARTRADVKRRFDIREDIDLVEQVCKRFCRGDSPSEIRQGIKKELKRDLPREQPYQILSFAAMNGLLRYVPPVDHYLAQKLIEEHYWLEGVEVVHTTDINDVAARAAEVLLRLVQQMARLRHNAEVRVGLAGGGTILRTVKRFGELLDGPVEALPEKLIFHAMVTGLQLHDPRTDPNTFFNYLPFGQQGRLTTKFVAMHGPALPTTDMINVLENEHMPTRRAKAEGELIDIIVTSGTSWKDHDQSQLRKLMRENPGPDDKDPVSELEEKEGCVADLLWQPVSLKGPIDNNTSVRPMILRPLSKIPESIRNGAKVLLVLGPCVACGRARDDVLRTVLGWSEHYITHLVADSRTATL